MSEYYDAKGYPVFAGDVLKVFHFRGARRKKYYMYKVAKEWQGKLWAFNVSELATNGGESCHKCRMETLGFFQIVDGYDPDGIYFEDRKKGNQPKAGER